MLGSAPKRPMRLLGGSCRNFKNAAESRMIYGFMLDREGGKYKDEQLKLQLY